MNTNVKPASKRTVKTIGLTGTQDVSRKQKKKKMISIFIFDQDSPRGPGHIPCDCCVKSLALVILHDDCY